MQGCGGPAPRPRATHPQPRAPFPLGIHVVCPGDHGHLSVRGVRGPQDTEGDRDGSSGALPLLGDEPVSPQETVPLSLAPAPPGSSHQSLRAARPLAVSVGTATAGAGAGAGGGGQARAGRQSWQSWHSAAPGPDPKARRSQVAAHTVLHTPLQSPPFCVLEQPRKPDSGAATRPGAGVHHPRRPGARREARQGGPACSRTRRHHRHCCLPTPTKANPATAPSQGSPPRRSAAPCPPHPAHSAPEEAVPTCPAQEAGWWGPQKGKSLHRG